MSKEAVVNRIKKCLDNLDGVCSNKLKAVAVLDELEKLGFGELPSVVRKDTLPFRKLDKHESRE